MDESYKRGAVKVFFEALTTGDASGAILNQEKRGQQQFNSSDVLPVNCDRQYAEMLGIVFGEMVDDIFVQAMLPTGWKKVATDHSMWTDLIDDKGRKRGSVFYKAAFYDRSAHLRFNTRYSYGTQPVTGYGANHDSEADREGYVSDQGKIIWRTDLEKEAEVYITEHYPDWRNPLAYWD